MKEIIRKLIPKRIYELAHDIKEFTIYFIEYPIIYYRHFRYKKILKNKILKAKNQKINIVFLPIFSSIWKYDKIYQYFNEDERFNVNIIVLPSESENSNVEVELQKTYEYFKKLGYPVNKYNELINGENLDIEKHFQPDIIFYTRPYKSPVKERYKYFNPINFKNSLLCYIQYGYEQSSISKELYNLFIVNMMWKFFHETEFHLHEYIANSRIHGKNGVITGYPGCDKLIFDEKIREGRPIVIWAPHHSVSTNEWLNQSTFLDYYNYFISLTEKYQSKIDFVFKPHPLLKEKLIELEMWGFDRTNNYYDLWMNGKNMTLNEGDYIELFNKSDALIHDSASFSVEYLYTGKPTMFLMKKDTPNLFSEFGKKALKLHYQGFNEDDIDLFLNRVVLNNEDKMYEQRKNFYDEVLNPNKINASKIIYDYIIKELLIK